MKTLLIAALACAAACGAQAQTYPTQPITFVVPFPPGGTSDVLARRVGQKIGDYTKQSVVSENVAGASTIIGAERVAKARPTGYQFLVATSTTVSTNPHLFRKLPYRLDDFEPVALLAQHPLAVVVSSKLTAKTFPEFVSYARTVSGGVAYASTGRGGISEVLGEMMKAEFRMPMRDIPYRGSAPAVAAILSGEVDLHFDGITSTLPLYRAGKLKVVAVTGRERILAAPELPTLVELGYRDLVMGNIYVLLAPKGTPRAAIEAVNGLVKRALDEPDLQKWLIEQGVTPTALTPDGVGRLIEADSAFMAKIVRELKILPVD